jgi:hypothetical protein
MAIQIGRREFFATLGGVAALCRRNGHSSLAQESIGANDRQQQPEDRHFANRRAGKSRGT